MGGHHSVTLALIVSDKNGQISIDKVNGYRLHPKHKPQYYHFILNTPDVISIGTGGLS